jgi:hypothetical protein
MQTFNGVLQLQRSSMNGLSSGVIVEIITTPILLFLLGRVLLINSSYCVGVSLANRGFVFGLYGFPNAKGLLLLIVTIITIFVNLGLFRHFETITNIRTWIKSHRYWRML